MRYQSHPTFDEKGFPVDRDGSPTPLFLMGVVGSTAEERQESTKRSYTSFNKLCDRFNEKYNNLFNLNYLLSNPEDFIERLASVEGEYPTLGLNLSINLQALTGDRIKDLRSFLVYYLSFESIPPWIAYLIDEQLDRLLVSTEIVRGSISAKVGKNENIDAEYELYENSYTRRRIKYTQSSQRYLECLTIYKTYTLLGREHANLLLEGIYGKNTLEVWKMKAKNKASSFVTVRAKKIIIKDRIRRRGNSHSSSDPNSLRSQKGRLSKMIQKEQEVINLEEQIERIKRKQAALFERRLDAFLALEDTSLTREERRIAFKSILGDSYLPEEEGSDTSEGIQFQKGGSKNEENS